MSLSLRISLSHNRNFHGFQAMNKIEARANR